MKSFFNVKYALTVFFAVLAAGAVVGGNFYYYIYNFVGYHLTGFPGRESILEGMNQILYSQIVVLIVVGAGISVIASLQLSRSESKNSKISGRASGLRGD